MVSEREPDPLLAACSCLHEAEVDSGVHTRSTSTSSSSTDDLENSLFSKRINSRELFPRLINKCKFPMKTLDLDEFLKANESDPCNHPIQTQWEKTLDYYRNELQCVDFERIEKEIFECFQLLIGDERQVMLGLDSVYSLRDLLILSMRILTEPDLRIELRIGTGGTHDPLTLRTPCYIIAGLIRLEKILKIRQKFSSTERQILKHSPVLTCFCAYSAAVMANGLIADIGRKNAKESLSYMDAYVSHYHPELRPYIKYELDSPNTYDKQLLDKICEHYRSDYYDEQNKQALTTQAIGRGSDENGSILYVSMHLIMFKDIVENTRTQPLFTLLGQEENLRANELYDCIITIGGSVEVRFNKVRHAIREICSHSNSSENYSLPLSIRMLSKAGKTPVYYNDTQSEITVDQILHGTVDHVNIVEFINKRTEDDLTILKDDIGLSLLKSYYLQIPDLQSTEILSWPSLVNELTDSFLKIWRKHVNTDKRSCSCQTTTSSGYDHLCEHYSFTQQVNSDQSLLLKSLLETLQDKIGLPFGTINERRRNSSGSICARKATYTAIIDKLDLINEQILIEFVRTEFQ